MIENFVKHFIIIFFIVLFGFNFAFSQEMSVPVNIQAPLLMKILSFDRSLTAQHDSDIVIGVMFQGTYRTSLNVKNDFLKAIESSGLKKIENHSIRFELIDLTQGYDIEDILVKRKIEVVFLAPVRGIEIKSVTEICKTNNVLTFSGIPDYTDDGVAVTIDLKDNKPQIIINLLAAKAAGADFTSQLLKLSTIIEP